MKRSATPFLLVICAGLSGLLQAQPVPNGDFESWTTQTSIYHPTETFEDPDSWTTYNQAYGPPWNVTKSSDAHGGKYSAQITPIVIGSSVIGNNVSQSFSISTKPLYFNGYYKSSFAGSDYANVGVVIYDASHSFLASTETPIHANSSVFVPFSLKLNNLYTTPAATATITITTTMKDASSSFWVDDITLEMSPLVTAIEEATTSAPALVAYPNPCSETLYLQGTSTSFSSFRLVNANGKEVAQGPISQLVAGYSVKELSKGIYFLEIEDDQQKNVFRSKVLLGN
jgi:hypothetical protein